MNTNNDEELTPTTAESNESLTNKVTLSILKTLLFYLSNTNNGGKLVPVNGNFLLAMRLNL
jgi:hypothetical protein